MQKTVIQEGKTLGPYSPALAVTGHQGVLFVSGQIGIDAAGNLVSQDFAQQVDQVLKNIDALVTKGGCARADIVKVTVYITDLQNFPVLNEKFKSFFNEPYPARATVQISALPKGALVEMDAIAVT